MTVVRKLPKGVKLSESLREHSPYFLMITLFGVPYYVAATPSVRQLLSLDANGKDAKRDGRKRWDRYTKADALRDIVSALHLQVRDVVLASIEGNVKRELLARMDEAMTPTVRGLVNERANKLLLPAAPSVD